MKSIFSAKKSAKPLALTTSDDFGTDFLNSLKSGKILKVRIYSNNEGYTIPFSLKGSAEAINFIQKNIAKTIDTDDWGDEPPNQP